ncbi:MAG: gas vesicle protein GvpG [Myxococcota bacterium]|nr:gas vesicle protein GvpG [Myxococcota bacterium]
MILVDRLLIGGIRFVLDKVVTAVDREMNDEDRLRERLLEAQMRAELGEIDDEELATVERDVMGRLRAIQEARGDTGMSMDPATMRVTGVEASFLGDDHEDDDDR